MKPSVRARLPQQHRLLFIAYSLASFLYRWLVLAMIFWFLLQVFEPYGLEAIGQVVVAVALTGAIVAPLWRFVQFLCYPGRFRQMKSRRVYLTVAALAAVLVVMTSVPLPQDVFSELVVRPGEAESLYVEWTGTLQQTHAAYGERVRAGQTIAELEDPNLSIKIEELQSQLQRQQALLESYRVSEANPLHAAKLAGETQARIEQIRRQLEQRQQQHEKLTIQTSRAGRLIPPPNLPESQPMAGNLPHWLGVPLAQENLHATLERQTLVGYVGERQDLAAMLTIGQEDLRFVRSGQPVTMSLRAYPGETIAGTIQFVSTQPLASLPRELSTQNGGSIAPRPGLGGEQQPLIPLYEARVAWKQPPPVQLLPGMTGRAKIRVGQSTLFRRLVRAAATLVKFR